MMSAPSVGWLAWIACGWALLVWPVANAVMARRIPSLGLAQRPQDLGTLRMARHRFWIWIAVFEWAGCLLALAAAALSHHSGTAFGLSPRAMVNGTIAIGIAMAIMVPLAIRQGRRAAKWDPSNRAPDNENVLAPGDQPSDRVTFLAIALTAAACEELMYRGLPLVYLRVVMPEGLAIALSVVAFVAFHGGVRQPWRWMLFRTAFALVATWLVVVTGSLIPAIVVHFCLDAMLAAAPPNHIDPRMAGSTARVAGFVSRRRSPGDAARSNVSPARSSPGPLPRHSDG
jgi:membrane protease YdiL (CAAX protease family)